MNTNATCSGRRGSFPGFIDRALCWEWTMRFVLGWLLPVMLAAVLSLGAPLAYESGHSAVASPSAKSKAPAPKAIQRGHVYLLRGLGNIWSRGIDSLAEQLTAKGVRLSVH